MGWVLMSERDVRRIEVLTEVLSGRRTVASAAIVLAITARQVNRLLIRFREDGGGGLIHKARGQSSNHSLSAGVREYVLELVRTRYADFGPTLANCKQGQRYPARLAHRHTTAGPFLVFFTVTPTPFLCLITSMSSEESRTCKLIMRTSFRKSGNVGRTSVTCFLIPST
jgi:hypothetical protein